MQQPLELILTRQWASHLDYAVWLYDEKGKLIYYNEYAEKLLGLPHDLSKEWSSKDLINELKIATDNGSDVTWDTLPINIALFQHKPAHRKFKICTPDAVWKQIESTAFPLVGQGGRNLGAISIFWEITTS